MAHQDAKEAYVNPKPVGTYPPSALERSMPPSRRGDCTIPEKPQLPRLPERAQGERQRRLAVALSGWERVGRVVDGAAAPAPQVEAGQNTSALGQSRHLKPTSRRGAGQLITQPVQLWSRS